MLQVMVKAEEPNATQKLRHPPKGQLVGYVRVSTFDQNENRQLEGVQIDRLGRLGRNLDDLRRMVLGLTARGVHVRFVKESLTFTGEDPPMANLLLSVMGAFAQFERELIRERQREGIELAKKAGAYRGRKHSLTMERAAELRLRLGKGENKSSLAREFGVDRTTVYRYAKSTSGGRV